MDTKDNNNSDHTENRFIGASGRYQLDPEIFGEELDAINSRRRTYGLPEVPDKPELLNQPKETERHDGSIGKRTPSTKLGLVGLAFSGGGIRSSTVNIGLIQGLGKSAVIERIDYLSTVSGGGFAGGCLSATLTNAPIHTNARVRIKGLPDGAKIHGATPEKGGDWLVDQLSIKVDLPPISTDVKCQIEAFVDEESHSEPRTRLSVSMAAADNVSWHKISPDGTAWGVEIEQAPETTVTMTIARESFPFAFRRPPHAPESVAMQHLREFADYLKPHRAFSALRIPALFIVGFTTNIFVLLPLLLAIAAVTYVIWSDEIEHALCTNSSELILKQSQFNRDGTKVIQLERYLVPPETCDQNTRKAVWVNLMNVPSRAHVEDLPGCKIQKELSNRSQTILKCEPHDRPQRRVKINLAAFDDPFEDHLEITIRSWATPKPRKIYHPTYWPQRCTNNRQLALNQADVDDNGRYQVPLARFLAPPRTCSPTQGSKVLLDLVNLPPSSLVNGHSLACTILNDGSSPSRTQLECDPDTQTTLLIDPRDFDEALRKHPQITVEARWNVHTFETDPISALTDSTFNVVLAFLWVFVLLMVGYPLWKIPERWRTRDTITRMFGAGLLLLTVVTAIELQPLATYYFASAVGAPKTGTLLGNLGDAALLLMVSATVIGGLIARSSAAKKFGGTILMYAVAMLGFLTLWLAAAYFTLWLLDCTHVPGIDLLSAGWAHDALYSFFKFLNVVQPDKWIYFTDPTQCSLQQPSTELAFTYFIVALLLYGLTRYRFNINKTSFHHFYRDRLSRAFSFNPWGKSATHVEVMPLEGLATDRGPLHILNATLNLPSTKMGSLKGRRCDFFTFTPLRVGGQLTGYVRTKDYAQAERGFDLISAMAISGAAAAPTMGIYT
ncbi:MAG: hypothetical protein O7E57_03845, partial [Gammaproteobacteria bacterium]|nr:hypothetical protein [Gammaproteobacteria bacterium]